tara:strand:- start:2114 stop:2620 length:507 start_codon:yes stop_codon:yes gene_type:complete
MNLIQVNRVTLSSQATTMDITGIDSDDVYLLTLNNIIAQTSNARLELRVLESGTANTTANYDKADKFISSGGTSNNSATNQTTINIFGNQSSSNYGCGLIYIYNAYNSNEYTFFTFEQTAWDVGSVAGGRQGSGVFTSASQVNGVRILFGTETSDILSGATMTLYKVV